MFTSFRNDPARIEKAVQISSFSGRYALETPGPGLDLPFLEDTQFRLDKWGANRCTEMSNIESDLFGLTRKLSRDNVDDNNYKSFASPITPIRDYQSQQPYVLESRASHPAWLYRDLENPRWETPWLNPQANLEKPFYHDIQTRILEKDYYTQTTSGK
jgi:hypothetical protein